MADENTSYMGFWWRPGEDSKVHGQPGRLIIEPGGDVRVELIGGFPPMALVPESEPSAGSLRDITPFPVIYGECGSELFTLLSVNASESRHGIIDRPERQVLSPQRTLRGSVYLPDPEAEAIESVSVQIDYLLFFSGLSAFTIDYHESATATTGETRSSASVANPAKLTARWRDISFTLDVGFSDFFGANEDPNVYTVRASERAELDIRFDAPKTISEADLVSKKVQDLLTLAVNQPCAVRATRYKITAPEPTSEWERKLSQTAVFRRVQDGIEGLVKEPAEQVRAMELARLDEMESAVRRVRDRQHVHVSGGKIVLGTDGEPLIDDGRFCRRRIGC